MRAVPCTRWLALSALPTLLLSRSAGLSWNEDERATTPRPRTPVSTEAISSVMPLAKKSCVASPELFSSGSTAIVGDKAVGACAAADGSQVQSASDVPITRPTYHHAMT